MCDEGECGPNEVLMTPSGACCTECVLHDTLCLYKDKYRKAGVYWNMVSECQLALCGTPLNVSVVCAKKV